MMAAPLEFGDAVEVDEGAPSRAAATGCAAEGGGCLVIYQKQPIKQHARENCTCEKSDLR